MENSQLSHQEVFNNKKLFSNKTRARATKVIDDILISFDRVKIVNNEDKELHLIAINHYYHDLCAVIFQLRQVVLNINNDADQCVSVLKNVITELNKIILLVQESLSLEMEKLQVQLKGTIIDVGPQIEKLIKIIEYDNLHEYKQTILDCQLDLVISVEALKLYFQHSYLSPLELEGLLHGVLEKMKNNLIQVKTGHETLTEDFSHYTLHSMQKLENALNHMRKLINTECFQNDTSNAFKTINIFAIDYINGLTETVRFDNPMNKMLDAIENCHKITIKGGIVFQEGVQAATKKNIGKEDIEKAKQLIVHIFISGIIAIGALNQSIENAIMKI